MAGGLLTDLYELNMAASYLKHGMTGQATFSLFVRSLPVNRGFLVAAGLEDCLEFLEDFSITSSDLDYLRREQRYGEDVLALLADVRFTGDVWAVPEGRVVHADEPLLEVTAPIAEAQLAETVLLNHITFQTSIASKAVRCVQAAGNASAVDFSFRRTQGVETGITVARASSIAGFAGTSNVEAARRYGLTAVGTMAHSYIQAFPDEATAFATFAADFPDRTTLLVDTYDTPGGIHTAIDVAGKLGLTAGIRLDSGNLAELAVLARGLLDKAGMRTARIVASGGLDEYAVAELVAADAPIDVFGIGTRMGVSADAPYLDTAYKLVQYDNRPVMKLSPGKASSPGPKQVYRGPTGDTLATRDEPQPPGHEPLLVPVMRHGRRVSPPEPLAAARERCKADLITLPDGVRRLSDPTEWPVRPSNRLIELADQVSNDLRSHTGLPDRHRQQPNPGT